MTPPSAASDVLTTPDPAAVADLTCPLCGYSLRGLTTPRCPECGFAFAWAELMDAKRDRHPWLFEHARRGRLIRAFLSTYVRDWLPRRFWRSVTPANPVHVRRLMLYWLSASLPLAAVAFWTVPVQILEQVQITSAQRNSYLTQLSTRAYVALPRSGYRGPLTRAALDAEFPPPWSAAFVMEAWDRLDLRSGPGPVGVAVAVPVVWPWLTTAALLVFQRSMRRAKVKPAHVLRVAVYGCDSGTLLTTVAVAAVAIAATLGRQWEWDLYTPAGVEPEAVAVGVVVLATAAVAAYRTGVAYTLYLRFHWPVPTVLAAQAIAVLAAAAVLAKYLIGR